jgi:hypothetical protein
VLTSPTKGSLSIDKSTGVLNGSYGPKAETLCPRDSLPRHRPGKPKTKDFCQRQRESGLFGKTVPVPQAIRRYPGLSLAADPNQLHQTHVCRFPPSFTRLKRDPLQRANLEEPSLRHESAAVSVRCQRSRLVQLRVKQPAEPSRQYLH